MSEMEDKINSILSDPESMEKISRLARQFMGGGSGEEKQESAPPAGEGFDPELLSRIGRLMSRAGGGDSGKTALLKALSPYLAESRRAKLEKAIRLAHMAKLAGIAFEEYGGSKGV